MNYKKKIQIAFLILVVFIASYSGANAGGMLPSAADIVATMLQAIATVIVTVVGWFLAIAGVILDFTIGINDTLTNGNTLIEVGWRISRDLANMVFVLVIIVIAFATIFRYRQYAARQLLTKLIIFAILINFSHAIAMGFIKFSNTVTSFFIDNAGTATISRSMANSFNPQEPIVKEARAEAVPDPDSIGGNLSFGKTVLIGLLKIAFIIAMSALTIIVFLALALMFLARYVALSILVIIAPLAWAFGIIPDLQQYAKQWWDKFIKWVIFGPTVAFFIYLGVFAMGEGTNLRIMATNVASHSSNNILEDLGLTLIVVAGLKMIIVAAIFIAGLLAAQSMGIYGAAGGMAVASGLGNAAKAKAKSIGRRGGRLAGSRALRGKTGRKVTKWAQTAGAGGGRIRRTITSPLRRGATKASKFRESVEKEEKEAAKKETEGSSLSEQVRRYSSSKRRTKAQIHKNLIDREKEIAQKRVQVSDKMRKARQKGDKALMRAAKREAESLKEQRQEVRELFQKLPRNARGGKYRILYGHEEKEI